MSQVASASAEHSQTGKFVLHVADERWEWDDDVYAIHGYRPHEVDPTTELILRHKHDDDRGRVDAALQLAIADGEPFNIYYRILAAGEVRSVVLVGAGEYDDGHSPAGRPDRLVGYYLDLTPELTAATSAADDAAVAASAAGREVIEQANGVLMLAYGLDANAAFAMLKWWSRNRNVKVRDIADWLVALAGAGDMSHPDLRHLLDALIDDLTADRARLQPVD